MAKKSAGGFASIHAARARKYKGALDRVEQALAKAGVSGDAETPVEERVEALGEEVVRLRRRLDDLEWEMAGG